MKKNSFFLSHLKEGILDKNPVLVQLIGMCPTLATTDSVSKAIGMGLAATAVLAFSNLFISLLRKFIPKQVRIASYIVIISGFVTAVEMLMNAYLPSLYESLGIFIPLIVVNCIILARAESFASKNPALPSLWDGVCMGLGFTFALVLLATVRETFGYGTFCGISIFGSSYTPISFFVSAPGAFIMLGTLIATVGKIKSVSEKKARQKAKTEKTAECEKKEVEING